RALRGGHHRQGGAGKRRGAFGDVVIVRGGRAERAAALSLHACTSAGKGRAPARGAAVRVPAELSDGWNDARREGHKPFPPCVSSARHPAPRTASRGSRPPPCEAAAAPARR